MKDLRDRELGLLGLGAHRQLEDALSVFTDHPGYRALIVPSAGGIVTRQTGAIDADLVATIEIAVAERADADAIDAVDDR
jgi:hypothetical protein